MDTTTTIAAPAALTDPALFINREVSWLSFNERVLSQATGTEHPLLERVKFVSIVATNLEEFFMIRVATLLRKWRAGLEDSGMDGLTTSGALKVVRTQATAMLENLATCWNGRLRPELRDNGIEILEPDAYSSGGVEFLRRHFEHEIAQA